MSCAAILWYIRASHCWRAFVAFPNNNTGNNPYEDTEAVIVQQTLYHDSYYPSYILLPVIPSV
ncbi:hypothetical protein A3844_27770 [Paenibacillus helianthi]|uniref:Secreted protein n=1 Tax=Paenibacillus helianthi TaxID=1349432 RepID=A0ABX3EFC9_9BACL|nr:hypothetical protein A3844_27770 [Paenibacillus helianthi]